jgi:hypothetical protein
MSPGSRPNSLNEIVTMPQDENSSPDDDRVLLCGPLAARVLSELAQPSQDGQAPQSGAALVPLLPSSHGNVLCFHPLLSSFISSRWLYCCLLWNLCKSNYACIANTSETWSTRGSRFLYHLRPSRKQKNITLRVESEQLSDRSLPGGRDVFASFDEEHIRGHGPGE